MRHTKDIALVAAVALIAVLGTVVFFQHLNIAQLKQDQARNQYVADFTRVAINQPEFVSNISARDALIWTLLVRDGQELPEASALKETATSASAASIPIGTHFSDDFGSVAYTIVVGKRIVTQDNPSGTIFPALAFYAASHAGPGVRFESLSANNGEMYIGYTGVGHEGWINMKDLDAYEKELDSGVIKHLNASISRFMCPDGKAKASCDN